jgi:hypothetical protein
MTDQVVTTDQPNVCRGNAGNGCVEVVFHRHVARKTGGAQQNAVVLRTREDYARRAAGRRETRIDNTAIHSVGARELQAQQSRRSKRKHSELSFQHSYTSKKWLLVMAHLLRSLPTA